MQLKGSKLLQVICVSAAAQLASCAYLAANKHQQRENPVPRIIQLIQELKGRIQADGAAEQQSYDQFACWCEDTLAQKAADISAAKDSIEAYQTQIVQLKGALGTHGANIQQLQKDIAANIASQKEATEVRTKETKTYNQEKTETEQCIGALEAAINVLEGAGTGRGTRLLATMQEAQLLSVAARIRGMLGKASVAHSMSDDDLELVKQFVQQPADFVNAKSSGTFLSAAQIANNPFGDYAPQSTRVQGILKSMYEAFTGDLEQANGEEAMKQKSYQELMTTKEAELTTLQATLETTTMDEATKTRTVADNKAAKDDAEKALKADEIFFSESKLTCKAKAAEWAERSRMRTEELSGMDKAIQILSDGAETFDNATAALLQVSSVGNQQHDDKVHKAYDRLRALATKYKNLGLARLAVSVKSAGHFDKVIEAIDVMIETLRREEQEDIEHRDRCQGGINKNSNEQEDLNHTIEKANNEIARLQDQQDQLRAKKLAIWNDMNNTVSDLQQLAQMRNQERRAFLQAIKDDANAADLLTKAIAALSEFYNNNGIKTALAQSPPGTYSDAPPETSWSGPYEGRKGEHEGVVAILGMIKEDLEKELQVAREEDGAAQKAYESDSKALRDTLSAQEASKSVVESQIADLAQKKVDLQAHVDAKTLDLQAAESMGTAIGLDCQWVDTHFDERRTKRKAELDGLNEAKSYLAGVEAGTQMP